LLQSLRLQFLALVLLLVGWAKLPKRPWSRNLTLQTGFLALSLVSATYAANWFFAYVAARQMFGNAVAALGVTWLMARRRDFVLGIWLWVLLMSYQPAYSILNQGFGSPGFFGDENDIAQAACTVLPFAIQGAIWLGGWRRIASGALALLFTSAIVTTSSRGGFVALVALVVYGILVNPKRIRNLAIAAVAALVFWHSISPEYKAEIGSISENQEHGSGEARQFLWATAWNMFLDNPVVGVGAGNFSVHAGRYQAASATGRFSKREYLERNWTGSAVHSLYFEILSETGILGSLLFVGIVIGHFSTLRRLRKFVRGNRDSTPLMQRDTTLYGGALAMAMVGFLAAGAFLSAAFFPYLWLLSAMAVALDRAVRAELGEPRATASALFSSPTGAGSERPDAT
jgi:O-antigen ligase